MKRITKGMVFSVDRGTDGQLAETLRIINRDEVPHLNSKTVKTLKQVKGWCVSVGTYTGEWCLHIASKQKIHYTPDQFHAEFGEMTADELLNIAETTYPPNKIVMQTVCERIGPAQNIADILHLNEFGRDRVRAWKRNPSAMPFSVWLTILIVDDMQRSF